MINTFNREEDAPMLNEFYIKAAVDASASEQSKSTVVSLGKRVRPTDCEEVFAVPQVLKRV